MLDGANSGDDLVLMRIKRLEDRVSIALSVQGLTVALAVLNGFIAGLGAYLGVGAFGQA